MGFSVTERQESWMKKNAITNTVRNARACGMVASLSLQHDVVYIFVRKTVFFALLVWAGTSIYLELRSESSLAVVFSVSDCISKMVM